MRQKDRPSRTRDPSRQYGGAGVRSGPAFLLLQAPTGAVLYLVGRTKGAGMQRVESYYDLVSPYSYLARETYL